MKKFFVTMLVCLMTSAALWAQEGKWGVGLNLGYGTEASQAFLGGRVLYDIDDRFDVVGSFNRYFKDGELITWDINADFHWNVYHEELFEVYPLVGLTLLHQKIGVIDYKDSFFGVNLGAGIMFNITENWKIGAEMKGQIMSDSQFVPLVTAMYRF